MLSLILALQFIAYVDGNYYQCGDFALSPHGELYLKGDCHRISARQAGMLLGVSTVEPEECPGVPDLPEAQGGSDASVGDCKVATYGR